MIEQRLVANLLAYSAQVASIVALATLLHYALRLRTPRVRHGFWRCLLGVCLLLPWVQPWQTPQVPQVPAVTVAPVAPVTLTVSLDTGRVSSNEPIRWAPILLKIVAAGAALRLLWTALGLWQLRRLRRAGRRLDGYGELQSALGAAAEIRATHGIDQPVTFGLWRPVVVVPERLEEQPPQIRRAVICHELLHVRRRDWMWLLFEEGVRAAIWFNPAVWWVISRIQLTREEVVDELAVRATGERRVYLEALLTFADAAPLTPAAAFSRRRHLFTRMMLLSKEAVMSSKRLIALAVVGVTIVGTGSWYAAWAFPLQNAPVATAPTPGRQVQPATRQGGAGMLESQARPITPENPIPRRLRSAAVIHPAGIDTRGFGVSLRLTLDASGRVAEIRPTSNVPGDPAPFVQAAIDAVRQWQYAPPAEAPIVFDVGFVFSGGPNPTVTELHPGAMAVGAQRLVPSPSGRAGGAAAGRSGGVTTTPGTAAIPPAPGAPVRVGGSIMAPVKTRHVAPEYPAIAQSARVQGVVILEILIAADGTVTDARILRSIPLLDQAARDAVMQWEFTPTMLNGAPVPIIMTATVQFTLPEERLQ